jgi:hypothetical protein
MPIHENQHRTTGKGVLTGEVLGMVETSDVVDETWRLGCGSPLGWVL